MKLQQLRYLREVVQHQLNISAAAESLYTSQPGISKQIKLLEDELGVTIFKRNGKHLTELTSAGQRILEISEEILIKAENIRQVAAEFRDKQKGELKIATTHTQARYVLPPVIEAFIEQFPSIRFSLHQGTPIQIAEMAAKGQVDMAIATEAIDLFDDLVMLPCYRWRRCILVTKDHPLCQQHPLTLEQVAKYPLITYVFGFSGRSVLDQAFAEAGFTPRVVLTAVDADVIKTYVKLGMGVGIIASQAHDPQIDKDLVALDAGALFGESITYVGLRRESYLRGFIYDFISLFAPHLTHEVIDKAFEQKNHGQSPMQLSMQDLPEK